MSETRRRRRRRTSTSTSQPTSQPLTSPRPQERILLFGIEGTGKSEAWLSIAAEYHRRGMDERFLVVDTDGSAGYSMLAHGELDNVWIWDASDPDGLLVRPDGDMEDCGTQWEAFTTAATEIRAMKPGRGEWVVIDRIDRLWDAVQSWWIEEAYGEDEDAYWAELRAEQIKMKEEAGRGTERDYGGFQGNRDWVQIKRVYTKGVLGLLSGPPCHKLAVAIEKDIFEQDKRASQLRSLYGETMPAGKKDQGADFWLTVHLKQTPGGEYLAFVRRTKDARFENPGAIDLTDVGFCRGFLMDVWGWE